MPPHLHPRSRLTTSLFTTTLAISFLVVGMPHILPCPAGPRTDFADGEMSGDGRRKRRRRRVEKQVKEGNVMDEGLPGNSAEENLPMVPRARECPVPKPGGVVGGILGFKNHDRDPPLPRVETMLIKKSKDQS
ncbi:MAG: hypothetical protein M1827_002209 [Pycnora praestabilis]|nr:MAG: hypothetical protein M1827_002209 [Pycnora praestabilis]